MKRVSEVAVGDRVTVSVGFTDGSGGGATGLAVAVGQDYIIVSDTVTRDHVVYYLKELNSIPLFRGMFVTLHHPDGTFEEACLPKERYKGPENEALFSAEDVDPSARFISHPAWALFGDRLRKDNDEG